MHTTSIFWEKSSVNVMKYLLPPIDFTGSGPQTLECTNSQTSFDYNDFNFLLAVLVALPIQQDSVSKKKDTAWKDYSAFLVSLNNVNVEKTWILDSGCTHHICKRKEWFFKFRSMSSEIVNTAADPDKQGGSVLRAEGIGDVALRTYVGNQEKGVILRNVYYVLNVRKNLMSVSQIDKRRKE